ncbi:hypothetical protein [Pinibacter aurantiacus]|uniref:Uncharacterized protein n=1 Tax=Pinibacter aurantiacus TaxID=2851599 RepID=A0A9E2SDC1_9BACT|nr:hypothetical protein [Pinibacter aurantiacus]MBV4360027.1 hypothetical protein [Pinibacter aurantiacus]
MYFFFRYGFAILALPFFLVYQMLIKKKSWSDVKGDLGIIIFFLLVWGALYYFWVIA